MGFIPEGCPPRLWMWGTHWTQGPQPLSTLTLMPRDAMSMGCARPQTSIPKDILGAGWAPHVWHWGTGARMAGDVTPPTRTPSLLSAEGLGHQFWWPEAGAEALLLRGQT